MESRKKRLKPRMDYENNKLNRMVGRVAKPSRPKGAEVLWCIQADQQVSPAFMEIAFVGCRRLRGHRVGARRHSNHVFGRDLQ